MGLRYFGPVDGHDVNHLVKLLRDLQKIKGPKVLHCITKKGKGFKQAEADQTTWHAPGKYNKVTGELIHEKKSSPAPKFQDVFGNTLLELAKINNKIVGINRLLRLSSIDFILLSIFCTKLRIFGLMRLNLPSIFQTSFLILL